MTAVISPPPPTTGGPFTGWGRRQYVVTVLLIVVAGFFVYDLVRVEPRNDARAELSSAGNPLTAVLVLRNVKYDRSARAMLADVHVEVRSATDLIVHSLAVSLRTTRDGQRSWLLVPSSRCARLQTNDHRNDSVAYRTSAHTSCPGVEISDEITPGEIWYPFDRQGTLINPQICVNTDDVEKCAQAQASRATPIRFDAEPTAMDMTVRFANVSDRSAILILQRRLFLRMVSVLCLAMSLIFVTYLIRAGDPKETMTQSLGVFAALWGFRELIVPDTVIVFPTVVDFSILTIFCVVFVLVLLRVSERPLRV